MSWIYSANRKRHQRRLNQAFRNMNNAIEKDNLWKGRFVAKQKATYFQSYEDNSGHFMIVVYNFLDKETGYISRDYYARANELTFLNGNKLFREMNDFIVLDCNVWNVNQK